MWRGVAWSVCAMCAVRTPSVIEGRLFVLFFARLGALREVVESGTAGQLFLLPFLLG